MSLERTAKQLDELTARRKANVLPRVDFEAYMKARDEDKANVKLAIDYHDDLMKRFAGDIDVSGTPTPWHWLYGKLMFRPGEITMWAGFNGHMKSLVLGYAMLAVIRAQKKACIASFEMPPSATLLRMARQCTGTNKPTDLAISKFYEFLDSRLWLYDQQGTVKPERVLGVVYYCAEVLGIDHIVIDSLMKCVADEDDYNGQKRFVDQLCAAARDLKVHIHLVHHSRKRDNEQTRPNKQDAKGSGSIVDQTDNYITVFKMPEGVKEKDPLSPDFMLYCDKQRHGEWEGQFCLWFDEASLQFKSSKSDPVTQWIRL